MEELQVSGIRCWKDPPCGRRVRLGPHVLQGNSRARSGKTSVKMHKVSPSSDIQGMALGEAMSYAFLELDNRVGWPHVMKALFL